MKSTLTLLIGGVVLVGVAGLALSAFGYFVDSLSLTAIIGGVLTVAPFFWRG